MTSDGVLQRFLKDKQAVAHHAGRLVRELKRNLKGNHDYDPLPGLFERVLSQKRNSLGKI